jgi:myo-inositol-1-phosphate synthase
MTESMPQKIGILIVGIGGNNGVTLMAGLLANKNKLSWETSSAGKVSAPNWNGCITQLEPKGVHGGVGFKGLYELSDAGNAAVGGWDIRSTPLGEALYESRILDYDLVRQVRDELNGIPVWRGLYDESFLGESQHKTATNIIKDANTYLEKVTRIREDIRRFIIDENVDGHTTVIWSASVERPADVDFVSSDELLTAIHDSDHESLLDISPSMLYAVASALEGCSFVNGGSQNTLSDAMNEIFEASYRSGGSIVLKQFSEIAKNPAYILGTDFKAGQTKFKTAAVEYIRALGLTPRVVASSNHLGNNDMLNLTSKKTISAKMRVKNNIFEPWEETDLDHKVVVMYTPFMLDEKRDIVEYTSLGFLNCPHTMLTYTRCMDSILCVPLMIDAAVWCDYFARKGSSSSLTARATAYLFKVPEGAAQGVDPGFHRQMRELQHVLDRLCNQDHYLRSLLTKAVASGVITSEQADKILAIHP